MNKLENTCWELFNKTGEVSYYLLYKALKGTEDNTHNGAN